MAVTRGCFGKVKSGTVPDLVGEVREWSFDESADVIDASAIGDCTKKFSVGAVASSGTISCWWDPADTGQANFEVGEIVALELYPGGDAVAAKYYEGDGIITGVSRRGGVDGLVESNFTFQVNGALTFSTVPTPP